MRVTPFTCELVTTTWPRSSAAPALRPFEWPRPISTTTTTHRRLTTTSPSSSCTGRRSWNRESVSSVFQPEGQAKLPERDALSQDMVTWEKVRILKCHNSFWMFISVFLHDFLPSAWRPGRGHSSSSCCGWLVFIPPWTFRCLQTSNWLYIHSVRFYNDHFYKNRRLKMARN